MFIMKPSKRINQSLIRLFDQSRVRYTFLVFPIYQLFAFIGIAAVIFAFQAVASSLYLLPIGLILAVVLGVPILVSWHLSCLLFFIAYFEFLARFGIPFMRGASRQLEGAVNWYRPAY